MSPIWLLPTFLVGAFIGLIGGIITVVAVVFKDTDGGPWKGD